MVRATRLMNLAERLRGEAETSVARLADDYGVSMRTVMRDLATLREQGLPISGQSGPGGGVRLDGPRGITAVHLTTSEVIALWLGARLAQQSSAVPWSGAATSAMHKLLASLPRERADGLRAVLRRVFVGKPASAALANGVGLPHEELLTFFEQAFTSRTGLGFRYRDAAGRVSAREVEPHGLLVEPPVWYLLSRDTATGQARTFRMDRIDKPWGQPAIRFRPDLQLALAQLPPKGRYVRADTGRPVRAAIGVW